MVAVNFAILGEDLGKVFEEITGPYNELAKSKVAL